MNESMIARWNFTVGPKDTIYLLGDFGFSNTKLPALNEIFSRLNGHKHLVLGNHDERNPKVAKLPWESINNLIEVRDNGRRVIACHFPIESWNGAHKGYLHAHGHSHGTLKRKIPHRFDVGVDCITFPASIDALFSWAKDQGFSASDHHGDL